MHFTNLTKCNGLVLTLVSVVLVFLLYMALRAYIAEREYRPMPRARTGFRLLCLFLADFVSPSAI